MRTKTTHPFIHPSIHPSIHHTLPSFFSFSFSFSFSLPYNNISFSFPYPTLPYLTSFLTLPYLTLDFLDNLHSVSSLSFPYSFSPLHHSSSLTLNPQSPLPERKETQISIYLSIPGTSFSQLHPSIHPSIYPFEKETYLSTYLPCHDACLLYNMYLIRR